jgi:hypothetical protein
MDGSSLYDVRPAPAFIRKPYPACNLPSREVRAYFIRYYGIEQEDIGLTIWFEYITRDITLGTLLLVLYLRQRSSG